MGALNNPRLVVGSLLLSLALAACGVFRSSDDEEPIAPAPGPSAAAPTDPPAPLPTSTAEGAVGAGRPSAPVVAKPDAGAPGDAGSPTDAGKADASPGDAGTTASKLKVCADKCQAILQTCLTPSFNDAGVPQIKDPAACKAASDACRTACAP